MTKTLTAKARNELAFAMYGRGWGACNDDERLNLIEISGMKLAANDVNIRRAHDGAWLCAAILGGRRVHRTYYGYTKAYALKHFRENPPRD
jgi:hypothetical protein